MKPYLQDPDLTLYNGDAREVLAKLPAESVHMCVTSPPFFGLRDYGVEGQIGLEQTPEQWVEALVAVFEEVRRVLRKDGTLWVECGDSYNGGPPGGNGKQDTNRGSFGAVQRRLGNVKPKDLIGQPFLLAFALREAGWYWRNVCIWHKPNPMPESVRDRFTVSHSYVLLFSKSPRYFFDAEAVREAHNDCNYPGTPDDPAAGYRGKRIGRTRDDYEPAEGFGMKPRGLYSGEHNYNPAGRNARSVWKIPTEPLPFEHYAAFPQALAERCIKAGTSERGCCPECGAPWVREVEQTPISTPTYSEPRGYTISGAKDTITRLGDGVVTKTTGWRPSCDHDLEPIPASVLDCFLGSGTTALVARRLGRRCIGIELSEKYAALAAKRTQQLSLTAEASA